jgi:tetratricopeptide (TPR) repeat protein
MRNERGHAEARRFFEQALTIFRQLDNRVSATGMMVNVAYEFAAGGELEKSIKLFKETFASAEKLGNRDIQGLASYDLGLMQQLEGNLQAAKVLFRQSLAMFQEVDDRTQAANATYSLGEIAMLEDDLAGAHKLHEQALMMRQASGQKVPVAESHLDLAALSLEEGGSPAGDGSIGQAGHRSIPQWESDERRGGGHRTARAFSFRRGKIRSSSEGN